MVRQMDFSPSKFQVFCAEKKLWNGFLHGRLSSTHPHASPYPLSRTQAKTSEAQSHGMAPLPLYDASVPIRQGRHCQSADLVTMALGGREGGGEGKGGIEERSRKVQYSTVPYREASLLSRDPVPVTIKFEVDENLQHFHGDGDADAAGERNRWPGFWVESSDIEAIFICRHGTELCVHPTLELPARIGGE